MKTILFFSMLFISLTAHSQVAINAAGAAPDGSAMLDITSINQGLLIPRMTTSRRTSIISPAHGLLVFDTTVNSL